VSVSEVKAFLGLITNMCLIPLPNIKVYWTSERKRDKISGDVMSRDRFLQISWITYVRK
jgi:hypothetical protein